MDPTNHPGFEIQVNLELFVFVGGVFRIGIVRLLTQTRDSLMSAATLKQVKIDQNSLEELPKSRLGGSWGQSWPRDSFGQQK